MGIAAIILGILGIICGFLGTFVFGTVGGIAAGVLGAGAAVLSYLKAKKTGKGGKAGIMVGVLAIVLAVSMTNAWSKSFQDLHKKALELKPDGLWAQVTDGDTSGGILGIINKLPAQDDATVNALVDEMTELTKTTGK